ncbi:CBS domain-containing protein [Halonatronum saccharophilum]|uniref:CBS domain-containing protein n=2 Tax=Halonatronum saccharophilum TaxID=150060 RepID=UPI000486DDA8|nr:CBS domain-containing protein [Halonatronum saccharophilum]
MSKVKNYMMRSLNSVCQHDEVEGVIRLMHKIERSVLPVVDDENTFLGTIYIQNILKNIIPERYGFLDINKFIYERNQAAENLNNIKGKKVKDYMSKKVISVKEDESMDDMASIIIKNKESYLYVVNKEDKLRGYISRADLLYYLLEVGEEGDESRRD